ncbi:MAG: OmpA family protein [Rhodocyclaceae bacterium]|nr:OmpA family protein [Rhodocyclaceae bacterium]
MKLRLASCAVACLAAACTTPTRVVLLPDDDGHVGKVVVAAGQDKTTLDRAYASADVNRAGQLSADSADREAVQRRFAAAISALPPRPQAHRVFFELDSDTMTAASRSEARAIWTQIVARPGAEVLVVGHTDTMGPREHNDRLSLARAQAVRAQLVDLGFDPARVRAAGRGERELLVTTPDETPEPRNRRAEIIVR